MISTQNLTLLVSFIGVMSAIWKFAKYTDEILLREHRLKLSNTIRDFSFSKSENNWSLTSVTLFNNFFGKSYFSKIFFYRSFLLTSTIIIAISIIWISDNHEILKTLNKLFTLYWDKMELDHLLKSFFLLVALNYLIDFISVIETRFVLQRLSNTNIVIKKMGWLLADAAITFCIFIFFFINFILFFTHTFIYPFNYQSNFGLQVTHIPGKPIDFIDEAIDSTINFQTPYDDEITKWFNLLAYTEDLKDSHWSLQRILNEKGSFCFKSMNVKGSTINKFYIIKYRLSSISFNGFHISSISFNEIKELGTTLLALKTSQLSIIPVGIFFYTTFLTSIWIWFFIIAGFAYKSLNKIRFISQNLIKVIDIEKAPLRFIILFILILMFCVLILLIFSK